MHAGRRRWCYISIGVSLAFNLLAHLILIACAAYLSPVGGAANLQTDESLAAREYAKHGGAGGPTGSFKIEVDEVRAGPEHSTCSAWPWVD